MQENEEKNAKNAKTQKNVNFRGKKIQKKNFQKKNLEFFFKMKKSKKCKTQKT